MMSGHPLVKKWRELEPDRRLQFQFLSIRVNIEEIKAKVGRNQYVYTLHADIERKAEGLTIVQIERAILSAEVLEEYPDAGRGESCLIVGFADSIPIHIVCGLRGDKIAVITVYIPRHPKFIDPWTRGRDLNDDQAL
jgi:hypothetical protein